MALDYGIGIGYPMLGFGNYGLGASGMYGSYDQYMPSTLGMNYGGYGMPGMMGMYNPMYMARLQAQMEEAQLQHAGNMHAGVLNNEVRANVETDRALVSKMLTNGDIQLGVQNLYAKVREGDQDGVCHEFDKLKQYVMNTYADELKKMGGEINPAISATRIIENVYLSVTNSSLRGDIQKYGETSFNNGFMQGFRDGHQGRYVDETMNHCFGLEINQKKSKDRRQDIGKGVGVGASVLEKGAIGAAGGATVGAIIGKICKNTGKGGKWGALVGALAAIGLDIYWKCTD